MGPHPLRWGATRRACPKLQSEKMAAFVRARTGGREDRLLTLLSLFSFLPRRRKKRMRRLKRKRRKMRQRSK